MRIAEGGRAKGMGDSLRIVFTGDIAFSKYFADGWRGDGCLAPEISAFLADADEVVGNVESPLTAGGFQLKRDLMHASDPASGAFLREKGVRIWSLANNHIGDCGEQGVLDTLACARENGCTAIGAGRNLEEASRPLILGDEVKVGILALAGYRERVQAGETRPGALTWENEELIRSRVAQLRAEADWVVLVVHGFDEFYNLPSPRTRERYRRYLDWGADIVVAHHPHVVQNYERVGDKLIFYSLGNFIFGTDYQRFYPHTDVGMLLRIDFSRDSFSWTPFPVRIDAENALVRSGEMPAIFCDIDEKEYRRLWPLEAERVPRLTAVKAAVRSHAYPDRSLKGQIKSACRRLKGALRDGEQRDLELGRLSALLGGWRRSPLTETAAYLRGDRERLEQTVKDRTGKQ